MKHELKAEYYIRYVDDFVILHNDKEILEEYKEKVNEFLRNNLKLSLHPEKSKILLLGKGVTFLGYRNFYYYKLLKKSNLRKFESKFEDKLNLFDEGLLDYDKLVNSLNGWFGYAVHANTYKLRRKVLNEVIKLIQK